MAIQVHFNGVVYDLDPRLSDDTWNNVVAGAIDRAHRGDTTPVRIDLADGRSAHLWLRHDSEIAIVGPRDVLSRSLQPEALNE